MTTYVVYSIFCIVCVASLYCAILVFMYCNRPLFRRHIQLLLRPLLLDYLDLVMLHTLTCLLYFLHVYMFAVLRVAYYISRFHKTLPPFYPCCTYLIKITYSHDE